MARDQANENAELLKAEIQQLRFDSQTANQQISQILKQSNISPTERRVLTVIQKMPASRIIDIGTDLKIPPIEGNNYLSKTSIVSEIHTGLSNSLPLLDKYFKDSGIYRERGIRTKELEEEIIEIGEEKPLKKKKKGKEEKEKGIGKGYYGFGYRPLRQPYGYIGATLPQPTEQILLNRHYPIRHLILEGSENDPSAFYGIN